MKFAFLVHPISTETHAFTEFDQDGVLQKLWGTDPMGFCAHLHEAISAVRSLPPRETRPAASRVVDELPNMISPLGNVAEGRLYEIPMDAAEILENPDLALRHMEQAADMAMEWGARILGLGSITGVIGGRGEHMADHCPIAVTTGNSLTVYSALQTLYHLVEECRLDLSHETVAVIGIPGSIASAVAALISAQCGELLLVGRQMSGPAKKLAEQLGAELLMDVPSALARARIIISATSTGNCIDQSLLQPGSVVIDIGVPTDVMGTKALRSDVLLLTGGLVKLPRTVPLDARLLWYQHGVVPSCLGETLLLALEGREESLSLGRKLDLDAIQEIGSVAVSHGYDFTNFYSFGQKLDDSTLVRFQKARVRPSLNQKQAAPQTAPRPVDLAAQAQSSFARHINPVMIGLSQSSGFVKTFVKGEGAYLYDAEGNKFLDFVSGFGSVNLGHNHPAVVEAVTVALQSQAPGFAQSAVNPYAATLAKELVALAPATLEMVFFANSGSEANEAALKLARCATGRGGFLSCERGYHGKTLGSLSVTGNDGYQRPFRPLVPNCDLVPYGDFNALDQALATKKYAALVLEPLQAEGGMILPPAGYLREAQALCRSYGTLLIVDEVQTGFGRTGTMFASERDGVEPDIMTVAKSLGGGLMPIGAMLCRRDLWLKAYGSIHNFALHTSTFSGGSLACAAGLAVLRVLQSENLAANAEQRGAELMQGLARLCSQYNCLREVRGRGLLIGLEFEPVPQNIAAHWRATDQSGMVRFMVQDLDRLVNTQSTLHAMMTLLNGYGIYTQVTRSNPLVLRVQPPLTISAEQVETFLTAVEQTCQEIDFMNGMSDAMITKSSRGLHTEKSDAGVNGEARREV